MLPDLTSPDLTADADIAFDAAADATAGETLVLDLDGFEGPLHLLLDLARAQKVDLAKIALVPSGTNTVAVVDAVRGRIDLAADYLVMASWLTLLKSRLLLPKEETPGEPSAEELAERLTLRLQRLEAIRMAAARLARRDRLGSEVFWRGSPEGIRVIRSPRHADTLLDLLRAYATQRVRRIAHAHYEIRKLRVFAIEDARKRLERLIGAVIDWSVIDHLLPQDFSTGRSRRSGLASTLSASLEMARDGHVELRQMAPYAPVYVRRKAPADDTGSGAGA